MFRKHRWLRWALVAFLLLFPLVMASNWANMAIRTSIFALALLSLVVLTGWVGQISLAQAALMGVGAFSAAQVTNHLSIEYPFHAIVAGLAAALVALAIGFFALRIRGLYLAIATLGFQWALEESFLNWKPFSGGFNGIGVPPLKLGPYDFSEDKLFYYLAWPTAILVILLVANLRDSKTGRAWFAIRGSEVAAKTLGIDVTRYKLLAFGVSGFIVGIAGSINLNFIGTATPFDYNFQKSITYLAIAVLGGIGAIGGALVGAIAFVFTDSWVLPKVEFFKGKAEIFAAVLLIFTILRNPAGIIGVREDIKERVALRKAMKERRARREGARERREVVLEPASAAPEAGGKDLVGAGVPGGNPGEPPPVSGGQDGEARASGAIEAQPASGPTVAERLATYIEARGQRNLRVDAPPLLQAREVTIRFGGVVANDGVSLEVRPGEICGLIGPNGAGKTTHFNCVNGLLTPNGGTVHFMGRDITHAPTHDRAKLGMSRTFQIMRLFPRLTVFENLMVGTHLQNTSGFTANLLMLERSRGEDRRNRERVQEILALLGIAEHGDHKVAGLPFGILRLVELGRALVTQPTLLLLDEPASGLDVAETDAFAEILFKIRDEMGHTIFIIEHDMRLVMTISDYVYVLDFGRNLAEGVPAEIQNNPAVIAAYLGEESVA